MGVGSSFVFVGERGLLSLGGGEYFVLWGWEVPCLDGQERSLVFVKLGNTLSYGGGKFLVFVGKRGLLSL